MFLFAYGDIFGFFRTGYIEEVIAGTVAGIFSVVPVIDGADYIVKAFTNENQVLMGAFFQLLMVVAYVWIPILMYSILSKQNRGLALGSVAIDIKPRICKCWNSGCIVFSDLRWIVTGRT